MKKNKLIVSIIVLIILVGAVVGLTYAAFNSVGNSSVNTVNSGKISMSYTEPSNSYSVMGALPIPDNEGMNDDNYFEFSVSSNATTNANDDLGVLLSYDISVAPVAIDSGKVQIPTDKLKIYLTRLDGLNETGVAGPIVLSQYYNETNPTVYNIYSSYNLHKNNNGAITKTYRLRAWVDYNMDLSLFDQDNKYQFKFKVNVNSTAKYQDAINNFPKLTTKMVKSIYNPTATVNNIENNAVSSYCFVTNELDDGTFSINKYLCTNPNVVIPPTLTVTTGDYIMKDNCSHNYTRYVLQQQLLSNGVNMDVDQYVEQVALNEGKKVSEIWTSLENEYGSDCDIFASIIESKNTACERGVFYEYGITGDDVNSFCSLYDEEFGNIDQYYYDKYGFLLKNIDAVEIENGVSHTNVVSQINPSAFTNNSSGMGITDITIPNTVKKIYDDAFFDNKLTSLNLPSSIEYIGDGAFWNNKITSLDFSNVSSLKNIGRYAFQLNKLTSVKLNSSIETIGDNAFLVKGFSDNLSNPNLTSIINPSGRSFDWGKILGETNSNVFEIGSITRNGGYGVNTTITITQN